MIPERDKDEPDLEEYVKGPTDVEELVVLNYQIDQTEHKTIVQALKTYLNTALAPMTQRPTNIAINALKRQKVIAQDLLSAMSAFSNEIVVSKNEFSIIRKALKIFVSLPKPLWQDIQQIRKIQNYQDTAVSLLENLKI